MYFLLFFPRQRIKSGLERGGTHSDAPSMGMIGEDGEGCPADCADILEGLDSCAAGKGFPGSPCERFVKKEPPPPPELSAAEKEARAAKEVFLI